MLDLIAAASPGIIGAESHKPDRAVEVPGCVTSVASHPKLPALFAVGLLNGSVCLVDTTKDPGLELVSSSPQDGNSHIDRVSQLKWLTKVRRRLPRPNGRGYAPAGVSHPSTTP